MAKVWVLYGETNNVRIVGVRLGGKDSRGTPGHRGLFAVLEPRNSDRGRPPATDT